jgi:hypothetical protein
MKKVVITLLSGRIFEVPLNQIANLPIGLATDSDMVLSVLATIAQQGFQNPGNTSQWIAPAQIATVECQSQLIQTP